jgi:hypothetical protein
MKNFPAGRMVYPWPWILLERTRQCLNSYLAHFEKASCYRLIRKIRERFFWLEEYFQWQKGKMVYRCPIPRRSIRFVNQKSWFKRHLPGHVLLIRQGGFWEFDWESASLDEVTKNETLAVVKSWPRRFPDRRLRYLKSLLWDSGLLVGWVGETGRRLSNIAERALICRWASTN